MTFNDKKMLSHTFMSVLSQGKQECPRITHSVCSSIEEYTNRQKLEKVELNWIIILMKELITIRKADKFLFNLAPFIVIIASFL